jgi:hypothetical protein
LRAHLLDLRGLFFDGRSQRLNLTLLLRDRLIKLFLLLRDHRLLLLDFAVRFEELIE